MLAHVLDGSIAPARINSIVGGLAIHLKANKCPFSSNNIISSVKKTYQGTKKYVEWYKSNVGFKRG